MDNSGCKESTQIVFFFNGFVWLLEDLGKKGKREEETENVKENK